MPWYEIVRQICLVQCLEMVGRVRSNPTMLESRIGTFYIYFFKSILKTEICLLYELWLSTWFLWKICGIWVVPIIEVSGIIMQYWLGFWRKIYLERIRITAGTPEARIKWYYVTKKLWCQRSEGLVETIADSDNHLTYMIHNDNDSIY